MTRAQQSVLTCDRCGAQVTGSVGSRKMPEGWVRLDSIWPSADDATKPRPTLVVVDYCPTCVQSYLTWLASGDLPQLAAGRR